MPKAPLIESLLRSGSTEWNKLRKAGKVPVDQTGATLADLFSANADLSGLVLVGTEWEKCDLSKVSFRETDLSNAYFHGGRLQDCDFRGANLDGATFERMKLLRCDFSGALGIDALELEEVDMDRVVGLGNDAPPPPPPVFGATTYSRDRAQNSLAPASPAPEDPANLPPFRPSDSPAILLARGVQKLPAAPAWLLDVPGQKPTPLPELTPAATLESLYRSAVRHRLEGRRPVADPEAVKRAQRALRLGARDAGCAALYLQEVGSVPEFRFSAEKVLKSILRAEIDVDDVTAALDPRAAGALLALKLPLDMDEALGEARKRLAATRLFSALLEAGFDPDTNWQEALDASDHALELAAIASSGTRAELESGFRPFAALPEEARLRRLAYLAETVGHLEALTRLPEGIQPRWLQGPESRECHEREMTFVQCLAAQDVPNKVPALAEAELGVPNGTIPEDSAEDVFIHLRCQVCGKEKLLVQSP